MALVSRQIGEWTVSEEQATSGAVEALTRTLWARAREVYGQQAISASIANKHFGPHHAVPQLWDASVCRLGADSIRCDGPTPEAAFAAAMERIHVDSAENLAVILGIETRAA